jgi:M6 family metalloprotease-like protein
LKLVGEEKMNKGLLIIAVLAAVNILFSAPFDNYPIKITQSDGSVHTIYHSGDEYFHYNHDENGIPVLKNPKDGDFYYARSFFLEEINDLDISSSKLGELGKDQIDYLKARAYNTIRQLREKYQGYRDAYLEELSRSKFLRPLPTDTISSGLVRNVIVPISFKKLSSTNDMFNSASLESGNDDLLDGLKLLLKDNPADITVYDYYKKISYDKLEVIPEYLDLSIITDKNVEITIDGRKVFITVLNNTISVDIDGLEDDSQFFQPVSTQNPDGFNNDLDIHQRWWREQGLFWKIAQIISSGNCIKNKDLSTGYPKNGKPDPYIDNITFVFFTSEVSNNNISIIYPHKSTFEERYKAGDDPIPTVNTLKYGNYIVTSYPKYQEARTIIHELGHSLFDLPDYYQEKVKVDDNDAAVGSWNVMSYGLSDFFAFDKYNIGWLKSDQVKIITEIDLDDNKIELYPLTDGNPGSLKSIRILSPYSKTAVTKPFTREYSECFYVENRKTEFQFRDKPKEGLLLYKLNDAAGQSGNFYFDEENEYKAEPYLDKFNLGLTHCKNRVKVCWDGSKFEPYLKNTAFEVNGYREVNDFGSGVFGTELDNETGTALDKRGGLILRNIDASDPSKMTFDLFFFDSKLEIEGESINIFPEENPVTNKDYLKVVRDVQKGEEVTVKVEFGEKGTYIPPELIEKVELYFNKKRLETFTDVKNIEYEWVVDIIDGTDNYLYAKTYGNKRYDRKQRVETSRRVYLRYKGSPEVKEKKSSGGKDKSELDDVNKRYFDVTCRNYDGSIEYDIEESQFYYRLIEDSEYKVIPSSGSECTWDVSDLKSDQYYIKSEFKWSYITETGEKYEKEQQDSLLYNLTRPITLGTISTVFKDPRNYVDPDGGSKYDNIDPLVEVDTLSVTVPLAIDPDKWGHVEILKNGDKDDENIYKPLTEPWYKVSSDGKSRIYKFVWDYTDEPEGFVTLRARYVLDTLSWSQKKTKVAYAETWEDFDNVSGGGIPPGWEVGTQYAYPPGNAPEAHYWRTSNNTAIYDTLGIADPGFTSNELRTSTSSFTSQRYEILSPVIEVPEVKDSVNTFLVFDYKRALSTISPTYENAGRSLMVIQVCDEGGNMIDQFYGAMDTSESIDGAHFPISGSYLNMPNFFWFNLPGLYGDNDWNEYTFWLNFGSAVGNSEYHDYSGRKIRLKFIQYFNNDFVGIVDNWNPLTGTPLTNPGSTTFNPPEYTELTYHQFDNFIVKTFYDINLPPTIKQVPDQEVIQHCGWQHIELTEISNGQNAVLGDYEDLDTQGKSSMLDNIVSILGVEETDSGVLKVTALAKQDDEIKEVSFNPNAVKKDSKSLYQQVIEMKISSSNEALLPKDSLKYEFTPGAERVDLYYHPADSLNGEVELRVWLKDSGGTEHNGRDTTSMKFKVNVIQFNAPKYDPPVTELEDITEDFPEFTINLGNHFKDPEGDEISYSIDADTSLVDITLNNDVLNVKSKKDVYGTGILTIMADDRSGAIPTVITANIDIKDDGNDFEFDDQYLFTNDYEMPVKNLAVNFEPDSVDITEMFSSEAAAGFTYSVTLDNDTTLIAGIRDHYIELTSIPDSAGVAVGTIRIGFGGSFFETKLKFVVGNLPPEIIAEIPDIETPANFETMYINLKDHYRDPNKDWLGYTVKSSQEKVDTYISFYDDQLIIESKANESGIDSLYISIYDGEFTVRDSLKITIGDVDVPVPHLVTPIPDQRVKEDFGRYEIDLNNHFADPAGTGIAYVVDFDSTKVKCSIEGGHILVVNSVKNFHGYAPIMVAIDDGEKIIRDGEFEDCDPKNVVRIREKIKKALTKLN